MSEKGGLPMFALALLVLTYLLCNKSSTVEELPAIPPIKQSLTTEPIGNVEQFEPAIEDPQPSPSDKKPVREIVIFTGRNCLPCDRWKRCEQPKFEANGWKVAYCEKHDFPITPTFLIEENGKTKEKRGYFSYDQIDEVLK